MTAEKLLKKAIHISLGLSAVTLILYSVLGTQVRMVADDFCSAFRGMEYGIIEGVIRRYQTWASEYTNFFIKYSLVPLQPEIHPWIAFFTLSIFLLSSTYLIWQLFDYLKLPDKKKYLLPASILFTFTFYRLMPSYQHAFWFAAVIPYTWSIIITLFFIGTVLQYFSKPRAKFTFLAFLTWTMLVIFVLGGFVSVMITSFGMAFVLLLLMAFRIHNLNTWQYIAFVLIGALSVFITLVITLLSPGVAVRRNSIASLGNGELLSPLEALPNGIIYTFSYIFGEFFGITYGQTYAIAFLASLFCLLFMWGVFSLDKNTDYVIPAPQSLGKSFILSLVSMILLIFSVIYPATYATSSGLPMRPLILSRFIQLVVVCYWAYLAVVYAGRTNLLSKLRRAKTWSLVLVFISILLIWSPTVSIYKLAVLYPDYHAYAQSWDERHEILLNTNSNDFVTVPHLPYDIEDSLVLEKMIVDSTFWINSCAASFYGVEGISVENDEE